MSFKGKIKTYHTDRGFGFIGIDGENKDVFFHITDFPNRKVLPQVGENIEFSITNKDGKVRASQIIRLDIKSQNSNYRVRRSPKNSVNLIEIFIFIIISAVIIGIVINYIPKAYNRYKLRNQPVEVSTIIQKPVKQNSTTSEQYTCDGRTYCSQMRSYEEAVYFINHCPGTKMDGNHDGIPCEQQFR